MLEIVYDRCLGLPGFNVFDDVANEDLRRIIQNHVQLHISKAQDLKYYIIHNGKKVNDESVREGIVRVVPCLQGGKGGFGSMLRAIGAQIEKTTNREACRDLSGRRLRDINEEKRLKKWISEQADREKEASEKKKRKLKKLCDEPKHEFSNPEYDKARSEMLEKVHDAVEEGLKTIKTAPEASASKAQTEASNGQSGKKIKGALWVDELDELDDSNSDENEDEETPKKKMRIAE